MIEATRLKRRVNEQTAEIARLRGALEAVRDSLASALADAPPGADGGRRVAALLSVVETALDPGS